VASIIGALNWGDDLRKRVVVVATGYFDDSGTHNTPVVTMAGYVSTMCGWKAFERESKKLFKREKIEVFHAKDFSRGAGEFRGWGEPRKMRFATDWFEIAGEHVFDGATISIDKAAYNNVRGQRKTTVYVAPYTYCLNIVMERLCGDGDTWELIQKDQLSLIFERGNAHDGGLKVEFENIKLRNKLEEHLGSATVAPKRSSRALQLADYLAFFSWQQAEKAALGTLNSRSPFHDIALTSGPFVHVVHADRFTPKPRQPRRQRDGEG
jgi:hypothetical protein